MNIYVEIMMQTEMEKLWQYTQTPEIHERWDLRFSSIAYLPRPDAALPQQFVYSTRIGFGAAISGKGETVGSRDNDESRTSALKFWSDDPRSLIRTGSGYWKYVPTPQGVRFLTLYNYETRFGVLGRYFDALVFRPLMGWATAYSFDSLRLWLEKEIDPALSIQRTFSHAIVRLVLAFIWIYQGVFPKLLFPDTGELEILQQSRLFAGHETAALTIIGVAEIVFGLLLLVCWRSRALFVINLLLLMGLSAGALLSQPMIFVAPFNPVTLNLAMIGLAAIGFVSARDLPSARKCRRRPEQHL